MHNMCIEESVGSCDIMIRNEIDVYINQYNTMSGWRYKIPINLDASASIDKISNSHNYSV